MPAEAIDLTQGEWQFKQYPIDARRMRDLEESDWCGADVPGSIYTSLIKDGQIERGDLFANAENYEWIQKSPWIYKTSFEVSEGFVANDRIYLVCERLDTFASVWVNEKLVAKTNNAFVKHRIDITEHVRAGRNILMIKFEPGKAQAESAMKRYTKFDTFNNPYRGYARKPQYSFGWDICAGLAGCGIFGDVRIEAVSAGCIDNVHVQTIEANQHNADVKVSVELDKIKNVKFCADIIIEGAGQKFEESIEFHPGEKRNTVIFHIERPFLWQVKGYGVQFLYDIKVNVKNGDKVIDQQESKFGIRTIKIEHSKDKKNKSFEFLVNDQRVKIKGAKFVPASIICEQENERTEKFLNLAVEANINMLRVWGGGSYGSEEFYWRCDELGILVWQDFMFSQGYYPDRQFFLDEIKAEATGVIKRLRNHACLAMWCGNDRCDEMHKAGELGKSKKFHGQKIYNNLLPGLLGTLDTSREYVPTVPFVKAQEADVQSLPSLSTFEGVVKNDKLKVASYEVEKLNYRADGNCEIAKESSKHYPPAKDIEELIGFSQLTQANIIKKYIEGVRAGGSAGLGMLELQYNDCCPAISSSVVDYEGNVKAGYEAMKQAYAPVLVAFIEEYESGKLSSLSTVIVNDTADPITAQLDCCVKDFKGVKLDSVSLPVMVGPYSVSARIKLAKNFAMALKPFDSFVSMELISDTKVIAKNEFYYVAKKYLNSSSR